VVQSRLLLGLRTIGRELLVEKLSLSLYDNTRALDASALPLLLLRGCLEGTEACGLLEPDFPGSAPPVGLAGREGRALLRFCHLGLLGARLLGFAPYMGMWQSSGKMTLQR
jgi:hypothetical protein